MPVRPPRRRPAVPHRPGGTAHLQRRRTRTTTLEDPTECLRTPDQRNPHPGPLHDPRVPQHRGQTRPRQDDRTPPDHARPALDARTTRPHLTRANSPTTRTGGASPPVITPCHQARPSAYPLNVCFSLLVFSPITGPSGICMTKPSTIPLS